MKRIALLLVLMIVLSSADSCSESSGQQQQNAADTTATAAAPEKVVLAMPIFYDMPDTPIVQDAINAIANNYGVDFEFQFINAGSWQQQSNLLLTGSEVDVLAFFMSPLTTFVSNGQALNLDDYYANSSEAFKNVWSAEEMKGTTVNGHIYSIPNMRNFGNYFGLNIDAAIAEEFGITDGQNLTLEDVDTLLYQIDGKYPERNAIAPQGTTYLIGQWTWDGLGDGKYIGVLPDRGQSTTVENLFNTDDFQEICNYARKWYEDGLIMEDILTNTEGWQTLITSGKAVTCFDNYGVNGVAGMIRTVIIEPWAVANSYAELSYGINANSERKDAAWKAIELLYTDREIGTLFNNGIEGTHYVKNDDGTISYPDGQSGATVGYGMADFSWATPYSTLSYPIDVNGANFYTDLLEFNKNTTLKSKAFGFAFDTTSVTDQYTACTNVMDKYFGPLLSGAVDVQSTIDQANAEFEAAGLSDIIAAKQEQLDAFLAGK
jgi:putative aldouronate transport system substrate-binding protein